MNLLNDTNHSLIVYESQAVDFEEMLNEVTRNEPDVILLDESFPLSTTSTLICLLTAKPALPVIVIGEDDNLMHIIHHETVRIHSPMDLINAINLT